MILPHVLKRSSVFILAVSAVFGLSNCGEEEKTGGEVKNKAYFYITELEIPEGNSLRKKLEEDGIDLQLKVHREGKQITSTEHKEGFNITFRRVDDNVLAVDLDNPPASYVFKLYDWDYFGDDFITDLKVSGDLFFDTATKKPKPVVVIMQPGGEFSKPSDLIKVRLELKE